MPYKDKEEQRIWQKKNTEKLKEYNKQYYSQYKKTARGQKLRTICQWKRRGINCNDEWEEVYDWWFNCKSCDICHKVFDESKVRCLDHDHTLEGYNVRGIICRTCNNILLEL